MKLIVQIPVLDEADAIAGVVKSRQDAIGRPKNRRNGVVMWKKRPAVPLTLCLCVVYRGPTPCHYRFVPW